MNDSDFTKKVFSNLQDKERKEVLKKAILDGFTVNGFSKKPYDAPLSTILISANCKKRKKYQYESLLATVRKLANKLNEGE